jgi:hypothetical protein
MRFMIIAKANRRTRRDSDRRTDWRLHGASIRDVDRLQNIQFTKARNVLRGMWFEHLSKNQAAIKELIDKGMAPK